jgi:NAD(P)-dependent dehydrogenase (short-subunit alcohol dehydrogenase family)
MLARGGGSIINTASIAGMQAGWGPLAYSSAKAAVIHMSKVAAAQLSPQKIRVNAICPGLIATSIFGASLGLPREVADQMAARVAENGAKVQPVPKAGVPDDIAQAALYLASRRRGLRHRHAPRGGRRHHRRRAAAPGTAAPSPFGDLFGEAFAPTSRRDDRRTGRGRPHGP